MKVLKIQTGGSNGVQLVTSLKSAQTNKIEVSIFGVGNPNAIEDGIRFGAQDHLTNPKWLHAGRDSSWETVPYVVGPGTMRLLGWSAKHCLRLPEKADPVEGNKKKLKEHARRFQTLEYRTTLTT